MNAKLLMGGCHHFIVYSILSLLFVYFHKHFFVQQAELHSVKTGKLNFSSLVSPLHRLMCQFVTAINKLRFKMHARLISFFFFVLSLSD